MSKLYVKPAVAGQKVHLEDGRGFLPEDGAEVARSMYWLRRIKDGSVVEARPAKKGK